MPFQSYEQEIWMRINRPDLYHKWVKKYGHYKKTGSKRKTGVKRRSNRRRTKKR